jgi:hypothetical protein
MEADRRSESHTQSRASTALNKELHHLGFDPDKAVTGEPITQHQREVRRLLLCGDTEHGAGPGGALWHPDHDAPPLDIDLLVRYAAAVRACESPLRKSSASVPPAATVYDTLSSEECHRVAMLTSQFRSWAIAKGDLLADVYFR